MTPRLRVSALALTVAATLMCAPSAWAQLLTTPDVTVDGNIDVNLGDVDATVDVLSNTSDPTTVNADVNVDLGSDGSSRDGTTSADVDADVNIGGEQDATADIRVALGDTSSVDASLVADLLGQDYAQVLADGRIGATITVFDVSELADDGLIRSVANNAAGVDALRNLLGDDRDIRRALTEAGVSRDTVIAARATNNGLQLFTMRSGATSTSTGSGCAAVRVPMTADLRAVANATAAQVAKAAGCSTASNRGVAELRAVIDANAEMEAAVANAGYNIDDVIGAEMMSAEAVKLYVN